MPRFFVEEIGIESIKIKGDDAKHINNVLRHKVGDKIEISDGVGMDYNCIIEKMSKKEIVCKIQSKEKNKSEPKIEVKLYQCMPKKTKMDLIIQKTVELGVSEIIPFVSEFTVVKLNEKTANKVERYGKISETASKQSGRGKIPIIKTPVTFKEAIEQSKNNDLNILAYEKELKIGLKEVIKKIENKDEIKKIGIFVGSEGGFTEEEIEYAKNKGLKVITLGNRILRTETAGIVLVNLIVYEFDK